MLGLRKALVLGSLFLGVLSSPATKQTRKSDAAKIDWVEFNALLDSIDSDAIHHALHSLAPKFKDGVFSKDRSAIEQVHSESPLIASKLVHIAKRQSSSNATTTSTTPTPSTPAQSSALSSSISESSSRAASVSSALSSAIYASTVPPPTTILVAPTTPNSATPVATSKGAVIFSTFGGGLVTLTSSSEGVSFTPSTSTHLFYTTLPGGTIETSTSVVVVNAPLTAGGGDAAGVTNSAGAAATSGSPGLASGAVTTRDLGLIGELFIMLGSAAAFVFAL
jgi:hypothetical protein